MLEFGLPVGMAVTDTAIQKKKFWIRFDSINKLKKKEMKDIIKIVDPLKESGLLIKGYNQWCN